MRAHCASLLAPYEVPEYIVFAQSLPTNAAGKTLKQPLMDHWGDTDGTPGMRFAAFCASMPAALMDRPLLMADGAALTPRDALAALEADDTLGRRLGELVAEGGVVALTKPNEARFRR